MTIINYFFTECMKQFAPACERNRDPILSVLSEIITGEGLVLEIGSGSGQHAAYFAEMFPYAQWQPTDLDENHASIRAWTEESDVDNVLSPLVLDLNEADWPVLHANVVVCINTIHIVSWPLVEKLFNGVGQALSADGIFYVYGPYRYANRPLEPSNEDFDRWLKERDPESGVRDFEAVNDLAAVAGLSLVEDREMPANNRSIWWVKNNTNLMRG